MKYGHREARQEIDDVFDTLLFIAIFFLAYFMVFLCFQCFDTLSYASQGTWHVKILLQHSPKISFEIFMGQLVVLKIAVN